MRKYISAINVLFFISITISIAAQDSLTIESLLPVSHRFSVVDGVLLGEGADFLKEMTSQSQFTMLGEYHGSKNISLFTEALIPVLVEQGYGTLVLEVGPISGQLLQNLPADRANCQSALKAINQQYGIAGDDDYKTPIPFFDHVEDAHFLSEALGSNWNVIGIDQEFCDGYVMLMENMYRGLSARDQLKFRSSYETVKQEFKTLYSSWVTAGTKFFIDIESSSNIQSFLQQMIMIPAAERSANALMKSVEIYAYNQKRRWYENNATRARYMKQNLRKGLQAKKVDVVNDKVLVKMGGYHVSKGISPMTMYDVGNTLNELAEFNGNTALGIGFMSRYEIYNGAVEDAMYNADGSLSMDSGFLTLSSQTDWVLIDLRPLKSGSNYYPLKYLLTPAEQKLVLRFDLLILTPLDSVGLPNY